MRHQRHKGIVRLLLAASMAVSISTQCNATPCDAVNISTLPLRDTGWENAIAKQLGAKNVKVLRIFRVNPWTIVFVQVPQSDDAFLFYSGDPLTHRYLALWAGAARASEQFEVRAWVGRNVRGLPRRLGNCFAWYVTNDPGFLGLSENGSLEPKGELRPL